MATAQTVIKKWEESFTRSYYPGADHTPNGVAFHWELASMHGASFILFREEKHTDEDITRAKNYIYGQRDVVGKIEVYDVPEDLKGS